MPRSPGFALWFRLLCVHSFLSRHSLTVMEPRMPRDRTGRRVAEPLTRRSHVRFGAVADVPNQATGTRQRKAIDLRRPGASR